VNGYTNHGCRCEKCRGANARPAAAGAVIGFEPPSRCMVREWLRWPGGAGVVVRDAYNAGPSKEGGMMIDDELSRF
jgi:hypothetical protein